MKKLLILALMCAGLGFVSCEEEARDQAFTITLTAEEEHGAATSDPAGKAQAGTTVTITATPKEGYRFKDWTIKEGGAELLDAAVHTTTFTMPANHVVIDAVFEPIPTVTYAITLSDDGNGTAAATVAGATVTEAAAGDKVTVTATPADGYRFLRWERPSNNFSFDDLNNSTVNPATLEMPAEPIEVKVIFEKIPDPIVTYGIVVDTDGNGTATAKIDDVEVTAALQDASVVFAATPVDGYVFDRWVLVSDNASLNQNFAAFDNPLTLTMPAEDVELEATFKVPATYSITVDGTGAGLVDPIRGITATPDGAKDIDGKIKAGSAVTINIAKGRTALKGYVSHTLSANVTDAVFTPAAVATNGGKLTFTMPDGDVTLTVVQEE